METVRVYERKRDDETKKEKYSGKEKAADTVVDADTTNNWENVISPEGAASTENVGRIWTDKSVFNSDYSFADNSPLHGEVKKDADSDFLVALSALGSTSNLKSTTTTTTPLDIVLVLDVSGSMGDSMTNYTYQPAYSVESRGTYYAYVNGGYTEIEETFTGNWWKHPRRLLP